MMREPSTRTLELIHRLESASGGLLNRLLRRDTQLVEMLSQIGDSTEYAALPAAIPFVFDRNRLVAEAALNAVNRLVSVLPTTDLTAFEDTVRRVLQRSEVRHRLTPDEIEGLTASGESAAGMVGLATMSYDGYVREAALRSLARISDGRGLPFIIVRLNDWWSKFAHWRAVYSSAG